MQQRQLILSRLIDPQDCIDKDKPGLLLAVLLVVLPIALIYASDVQAFI